MTLLTVLVGDDDPHVKYLLSMNLEKRNWLVDEPINGSQVIDYPKRQTPDLIMLDLDIPEVNGYEVCTWIRSQGFNVPIMVLTAYTESDSKTHAMQVGATDFAAKPFKPDEFLPRLRALVNHTY